MTTNSTIVPAPAPIAADDAAIRPDAVPLSEEQALDWLRSRPGGRITMSDAELGRRWGWHRQRVGRRVEAWCDAGLVKRRGDTVTAVSAEGVTNGVTAPVTGRQVMPMPSRKLARPTISCNSPASRVVRRALAPAETEAPIITFVPEQPPAAVAAPASAPAADPPAELAWSTVLLAGLAFLIGLAFVGVGLTVNADHYWSLAQDGKLVLAALGAAIDLAAVILLSLGAVLWRSRNWLAAAIAFGLWLVFAPLSMIPTAAFTSQRLGDAVAGRRAVVSTATALTDQRTAAITAAQLAAAAATKAREGECGKRGPLCRDREADERTALTALSTAIGTPVPAVASIGAADPGTRMLADILGPLGVSESMIGRAQVAGLTVAPATAGLFLMFSALLLGRRR